MKSPIGSSCLIACLVLLCFAPCAFAQNVNVTSAGNFVYDNVYVSPYYATVNGVANTQVICNDFADETKLNTSWPANITQFSNLSSSLGNTVWGAWYSSAAGGSISSSTITQWYEEAAWLTLQLLAQPSGTNNQAWYSYAVWAVFDPSGVVNWLKSFGDTTACNKIFGSGNNCVNTNVTGGYLQTAQADYMTGNYSNFEIISPTNGGTVCTPYISGHGNCNSQEFFMLVAEGGTAAMYLLLAALSCVGAMLFRSRRQHPSRGIA
jgi:hypothetical protein